MKFLLALSLLASSVAFAGEGQKEYKCWDTTQERGEHPSYVFKVDKENGYLSLKLKYPSYINLERKHHCWVGQTNGGGITTESMNEGWFKVCPGEGQNIAGLIPVEVQEDTFEGTVYCEKGLGKVFKRHHGDML